MRTITMPPALVSPRELKTTEDAVLLERIDFHSQMIKQFLWLAPRRYIKKSTLAHMEALCSTVTELRRRYPDSSPDEILTYVALKS